MGGVAYRLLNHSSEKRGAMLYQAYKLVDDVCAPARIGAAGLERRLRVLGDMRPASWFWDHAAAACELVELSGFTHVHPGFGVDEVVGHNGGGAPVRETRAMGTPFCDLVRFRRADAQGLPRVLLVAPMSGHYATLLRSTVISLLPDCDVYVTDWNNARDIPVSTTPKVGASPLELWSPADDVPGVAAFRNMHAGNRIKNGDGTV